MAASVTGHASSSPNQKPVTNSIATAGQKAPTSESPISPPHASAAAAKAAQAAETYDVPDDPGPYDPADVVNDKV